jgi:hypothetical protein
MAKAWELLHLFSPWFQVWMWSFLISSVIVLLETSHYLQLLVKFVGYITWIKVHAHLTIRKEPLQSECAHSWGAFWGAVILYPPNLAGSGPGRDRSAICRPGWTNPLIAPLVKTLKLAIYLFLEFWLQIWFQKYSISSNDTQFLINKHKNRGRF